MWYLLSRYIYAFLGFIILAFAISANADDNKELALIVHPSVITKSIDVSVARAVFTRKLTRWFDGNSVRVFVLPDNHNVHRKFVKEKLGLFPYQLRQIWDRMVFSGIGEAPEVVETVEKMYQAIKANPGAIGYAPVSNRLHLEGVNYVFID